MPTVSPPTSPQPRPRGAEAPVPRDAGAEFLRLFGARLGGEYTRTRSDVGEKLEKKPLETAPELSAPPTAPPIEAHAVASAELGQAAGYAKVSELESKTTTKPGGESAERPEAPQREQTRASTPSRSELSSGQTDSPKPEPGAAPAPPGAKAAQPDAQALPQQASPVAQAARGQGPIVAQAAQAAAAPVAQAAAPVSGAPTAAQPTAVAGIGKAEGSRFQLVSQAKPAQSTGNPRESKETFEAQLAKGLAAVLKQKGGSVTMRLRPDELGAMRIHLKLDGASVEARFESGSERARSLLEQNLTSLRSALEAKGLAVERLRVEAPAQDGAPDEFGAGGERSDGSGREQHGGPWERAWPGGAWGGASGGTGRDATDGGAGWSEDGVTGGSGDADAWRIGDAPGTDYPGEGDGARPRLSVDTVV